MDRDWTPARSVAALLVGMSMIDGSVDESEVRAVVEVMRGFPGLGDDDPASIGQEAYSELWSIADGGGDLVGALREHGERLAQALPVSTLESVLERLEDMADADGEIHPMEARLINAFRLKWGIEDDGSL